MNTAETTEKPKRGRKKGSKAAKIDDYSLAISIIEKLEVSQLIELKKNVSNAINSKKDARIKELEKELEHLKKIQ